MKTTILFLTAASVCGSAMGGMTLPNVWGAMEHIEISMGADNVIHTHVMTDVNNRVEMNRFAGESYSGAASVLDDSFYSSQYGWVADGFINLGADEFMWVEHVSSTAGLNVYEGGMRMMRSMHSYSAILGTDGSSDQWMWGGTMVHNWYSADALGEYEATYRVFVGDANGTELAGFTSADVTLHFNAVPSASSLAILGLGGLISSRRRRA